MDLVDQLRDGFPAMAPIDVNESRLALNVDVVAFNEERPLAAGPAVVAFVAQHGQEIIRGGRTRKYPAAMVGAGCGVLRRGVVPVILWYV